MYKKLGYCINLLSGKDNKSKEFRKDIKAFRKAWVEYFNESHENIKDIQLPLNFDPNNDYVYLTEDILGYNIDRFAQEKILNWKKQVRKEYNFDLILQDINNKDLNNFDDYKKVILYEYTINKKKDITKIKSLFDCMEESNNKNSSYLLKYFFNINYENYKRIKINKSEVEIWLKEIIKNKKLEENYNSLINDEEFKIYKELLDAKSVESYIKFIKNLLIKKNLYKIKDLDINKSRIEIYRNFFGDRKFIISGIKQKCEFIKNDKKIDSIIYLYMDSINMNDELWKEFKNLIFKWSYEKNKGLKPLYDKVNIHQHPFYSFISSCIIFRLNTIYDPTLFLPKTKDQILYMNYFISNYSAMKKDQKKLEEIKQMINQEGKTIQDIKELLNNDKKNDIFSYEKVDNTPIFIYPGKLPSKKNWKQIYDKQKDLGNISPGKTSSQTNKRLKSYKNYLYSLKGINDKELMIKFYLNNEENFEDLDADERKKKYDLIEKNRNNLIKKFNLFNKKT
jgi:hypothetical protein